MPQVPYYKNKQITFQVSPSEQQFTVEENSVTLTSNFVVTGFSVSGQVMAAVNVSLTSTASILHSTSKLTPPLEVPHHTLLLLLFDWVSKNVY